MMGAIAEAKGSELHPLHTGPGRSGLLPPDRRLEEACAAVCIARREVFEGAYFSGPSSQNRSKDFVGRPDNATTIIVAARDVVGLGGRSLLPDWDGKLR